jgi:WD domain, G-beta repeat
LELQIQPSTSIITNTVTSAGATTPPSSNGINNNATSTNNNSSISIPYTHNMAISALHMASVQPNNNTASSSTETTIQIATGSRDGSIRLWAYRNGTFVLVRTLCGHAREVTGLVLLSAQNLLWSASIDQCIRIWNTISGDCQYCITGPPVADLTNGIGSQQLPQLVPISGANTGHTMPITALIPYVSSAGTFILSSSLDQTVKVWNAVTGECVASESHTEAITCMTIARDLGNNELLLLGLESGAIQCRNIQPYANIAAFQLIFTLTSYHSGVGHDGAVKCITAGPSGTFYSGGVDGKMLVCSFCGDLGLNA